MSPVLRELLDVLSITLRSHKGKGGYIAEAKTSGDGLLITYYKASRIRVEGNMNLSAPFFWRLSYKAK